jgi:UDPglucose--hexose-1-phosphate uridylyltransferase
VSDPQLRIDQLTGSRVLLAPGRSKRPEALLPDTSHEVGAENCPFCEGREDRTPPEIAADRPDGSGPETPGWGVRVVPNLYPALGAAGDGAAEGSATEGASASSADPLRASTRRGEANLFASRPATGAHEVIIHSPRHETSLGALDTEEIASAVAMWRERMRAHGDASYLQLIVNEGRIAGASLEHTHAQLYALPFVPNAVARERERSGAYRERTAGGGLLSDILVEEIRRKERLVAVDDEAALVCPWASRSPFELRVIPRRAEGRFEGDEGGAAMIGTALRALAARFERMPPLNLWVRTAPAGAEAFHWHVDIAPRLTVKAGFELGTGVDINVYSPEQAAADLREVLGEKV